MSLTADAVIALLEMRFDYQSARVVFKAISGGAEGPFDAAAAEKMAAALIAEEVEADTVAAAIKAAAPAAPQQGAPKGKPDASKNSGSTKKAQPGKS